MYFETYAKALEFGKRHYFTPIVKKVEGKSGTFYDVVDEWDNRNHDR